MMLTMGQHLAAKRLKAQDMNYAAIARKIHASERDVRNALDAATSYKPCKKPRRPRELARKTATSGDSVPFGWAAAGLTSEHHGRVPDDVLAERDRRLSLPKTLAMELLGDPVPGRSALDRRAGGV